MLDQRLYLGVAVGFVAVLVLASLMNKLGDVMFRNGIARPLFVRGHRIHHRDVLLLALPGAYAIVVSLVLLGLVAVVWRTFWTGIETTFLIAAACLLLDLGLDRASVGMKVRAMLPHEIVYFLIPVYVFTHVLVVLP